MRSVLWLMLSAVLFTPAAHAQEQGEVAAGRAYAEEVCARCHAIDAGETSSPHPKATPFQKVANRPEMSAVGLAAWLRTPHPNMPSLIVETADLNNLIAYITSLKE